MPIVVTTSSLCDQYTGGSNSLEVTATNIGELIRELDARFPGLGHHIEQHMAIAIDGEIYQHAWAQPIHPDSEVYLIQRISGG